MNFIEFFIIAYRSLLTNKLRSLLTMLGLVIGVGAVITLMSLGSGLQVYIASAFEELGTNIIYVQPSNPDVPSGIGAAHGGYATPTLTLDDAGALTDVQSVTGVVPVNENFVLVSFDKESVTSMIEGTTPEFLKARGYEMGAGRFISKLDIALMKNTVVLGSETAEQLFGDKEPTRQTVKIKRRRFTVIGVLAPQGGSFFGASSDELVVVPITTYQSRLFTEHTINGEDTVQSIAVMVSSSDVMEDVKADIETVLRKRHHIDEDDEDDFAFFSPEQMLEVFGTVTLGLTIFLGLIASISLLVSSIGIMNTMLVSVTERTREIGIRKAVGAKYQDILLQFLLEAATLSLAGGGIGIAVGVLVSKGISWVVAFMDIGFSIEAVVSPSIIILAVSVSVIIGIASGIYPAMRAARLNPIDALHYG